MAEPPVEPDAAQLAELTALAASAEDGPLVMLNLNRYRDRDAYGRYAAVALRVLARVGARIVWHAEALGTVIGTPEERYDEMIAVWYPSAAAFLALATDPEVAEVRAERAAGLERATLIRLTADGEPVPFPS